MSNRYPIKETVKVLTITKPNQKIRFQIRHPENVYAIIGIAVTCSLGLSGKDGDMASGQRAIKNMAGHLTLAIAEKGDVIFTDDVQVDTNNYTDLIEKRIIGSFFPGFYNWSGTGKVYFETNYLVTESILEGYYEDAFFPKLTLNDDPPNRAETLYQVRVYLRYQTLKEGQS